MVGLPSGHHVMTLNVGTWRPVLAATGTHILPDKLQRPYAGTCTPRYTACKIHAARSTANGGRHVQGRIRLTRLQPRIPKHCWCQKTRVIAVSCGIKIPAVHHLVLSQYTGVTNRRTDRQTDGQNCGSNTVRSIASRGKTVQL